VQYFPSTIQAEADSKYYRSISNTNEQIYGNTCTAVSANFATCKNSHRVWAIVC